MLEMLLVLIIIGLIAASGVWGVEHAVGLHTRNQVEQEVITQISSLRTRPRAWTEGTHNVKGRYIKSWTLDGRSIVLTAEGLSEDVCRALLKDSSETTLRQKGYVAQLSNGGGMEDCGLENTIEFVTSLGGQPQ